MSEKRFPSNPVTPTLPACTPDWVTLALVQRTIEVWQPHYPETLTVADAVAIILSVSHLFGPD
jgi:hypothetical protein